AASMLSAWIRETSALGPAVVAAIPPRSSARTHAAAVTRTVSTVSIGPLGRSWRALPARRLAMPAPPFLKELRHHPGGVDHPVREAPLVVVPAHHACELAFEHGGFEAVDRRAGRV